MSVKEKLFSEYKAKYNISDDHLQKCYNKCQENNWNLDIYIQIFLERISFNLPPRIPFLNTKEEDIVCKSNSLEEGLLEVKRIREKKEEAKRLAEIERKNKLKPFRDELLELCKKYNAELVDEDELYSYFDDEIEIDRDFAFAINLN
jgi:hypothetical protein